ncbi:pyrroline-5-carboxylate reductase [Colwellia sp. PAMC 20917]|jgi:pyrroline-5-carboxylate reductase|uniref:pyrroline-5-carboxylate reductase n=1 Tax=unclassified Colwellia TaxID=196834 RepID=UPI0008791DEA|nr:MULTISPECIES: pyrroline-5-carboxylate reductase [unclassified Colwellia]AOW76168.1 pyrroline-5-carboxylate reductase [Colwellia sp. PAMC 20917]MBA6337602.1 pyrroline-5-carboxylate reductase [Colwellia sp. BRX8-7]MBA6351277.1 pyrroline-5-carboxylate reductase [Colwellia sp. BRX9-1]MBA6354818.1 pyrroline-5-carboxylate reductase [Colwellia sp. BRX8-3]MBA6360060.1 pyrroline-5-carboxylate reductase [Colwellia sp. BRX8-6]|tara:strand:- start:640 stop:1455 length:816 start_codon:yes stop_codon:yes gene_type:complete
MTKIAFIGAGNMNGAIISGLVNTGFAAQDIIVSNPSPEKRLALQEQLGIKETADNIVAANFADFIVLGVKPHFIAEVCQKISQEIDISNKCFISVAAGCTVAQMQKALAKPCGIIRTMPNTPSQIGLGVTGLYADENVNTQQKQVAEELMSSVGIIKWLATEDEIDNIIAVSGSAPAYFFLFMEAMEKQAIALGFSAKESRELVQQTALGAAQMVVNNDIPISELRAKVTSKGGTTNAAINSFIDDGLDKIVTNAMNSALHRAKEMAQNNV